MLVRGYLQQCKLACAWPLALTAACNMQHAALHGLHTTHTKDTRNLHATHNQVQRTARVPDDTDRDRVRFWHYPALPDLPPKLAPVDALVIEDAAGRLEAGRGRLLDQVSARLLQASSNS